MSDSVWYWPRAKTKDGNDLFTYDSVPTLEDALDQFSVWQECYYYEIVEAWIDCTDGKRIKAEQRWVEAETDAQQN